MREYLRKFFDYQDQLFWSKDIDDTDKRIDMWLKSDECEALNIPVVVGTLQEHKQVIRDLMETYIINLDENGSPKASITDIMKLIDRAVKLVGNDR